MDFLIPDSNTTADTLVDILRYRAEHQPDKIAYIFLDVNQEYSITYAELDKKARAIAAQLQRLYKAGDRSILIYPPGIELIAAYFGCLYAGIISVPVYPLTNKKLVDKLQLIVQDAKPQIILSTQAIIDIIDKYKLVTWVTKPTVIDNKAPSHWDLAQLPVIKTDRIDLADANKWQKPAIDAEHLAFLQYTSGSTGNPKGVMVSHRNLLHNLQMERRKLGITKDSIVFSWLPPYHDLGLIAGILQPFYSGILGGLMAPLNFLQNPFAWLKAISDFRATFSPAPTFAYNYCVKKITPEQKAQLDLSCWDVALIGAEPIHINTLKNFVEAFAPCGFKQETIYPAYGLAESTLVISGMQPKEGYLTLTIASQELQQHRIKIVAETALEDKQTFIGCGWADNNAEDDLKIVDAETLTLCEADKVGEVWFASPSVTQGYWQKPELTEKMFNAQIVGDNSGRRYLRTGDYGFLHNGQLYITGRLKDVIIIHGRNYYPQDIEYSVVQAHPLIRQDCCVAFSITEDDEEHIAIVCGIDKAQGDLHKVYTEISEAIEHAVEHNHQLAAHTIALIPAKALPKTTSGKIRRRYTKELLLNKTLTLNFLWQQNQQDYRALHAYVAPTNPLEESICNIICELIEVSSVGITDDLFHLGADSLTVAQLLSRITALYSVKLEPEAVFDNPTPAALAKLISAAEQVVAITIPSRIIHEDVQASFAQQRLWFLDKLFENKTIYNIPIALRLKGYVNIEALQRAFDALLIRHEVLRTRFIEVDGKAIQVIESQLCFPLTIVDISSKVATQAQQDILLDNLIQQEAGRAFDLSCAPLIRGQFIKVNNDESILLITQHHIITDGWSMHILARDISQLYNHYAFNETLILPNLPIQFSDYAAWQRRYLSGARLEQTLAYWKQQLKNVSGVLELTTDKPRPKESRYTSQIYRSVFSRKLIRMLTQLSKQQGVTMYMTLLASLYVLLYRYTQQDDIVIGSPIANRTQPEMENLLGYFVSMLALRGQLNPSQTFIDLLQQVKVTTLSAYNHQDMPYERLLESLKIERDLSRNPLFQVMLVLQNNQEAKLDWKGLAVTSEVVKREATEYDLIFELFPLADGRYSIAINYAAELYNPDTIERMVRHWHVLLEAITTRPQTMISQLSLLTKVETNNVLSNWNLKTAAFPNDKTIQQLFEEQVERTPNAIAVEFDDERLTYRELNQQANQLAHYLRSLGIKPDILVAISLDRGLKSIISLLAILKSGGAYVPLDPAYPEDRLEFMLEDTQTPVLITHSTYQGRFKAYQGHQIYIDKMDKALAQEPMINPLAVNYPNHLAYVIYTSGSTGRPKGVMIEHKGVINCIYAIRQQVGIKPEEIFLAVTSLSFDVSVLDYFLPFALGAKVIIANQATLRDPMQLISLLDKHNVSVMQATPATWQMLINSGWQQTKRLKMLIAGEALAPKLALALCQCGELFNIYGPTEITIYATLQEVHPGELITIGRPILNTCVYILDKHLQPVPVGVPGELYVGGIGVARGYLNREALTQERFIENPFGEGRLYKTGDLVRFLADGSIEYLGRSDFQVKVRGFRIELGEIENTLRQQPQVKDVAVIVREDVPGDKRLVAYIVGQAIDFTPLKGLLKTRLPEYMIPSAFVALDSLPLNSNGKLERKALPIPEYTSTIEYIAPQTDKEQVLVSACATILNINEDRISINANFFELGGDSLLATRLIMYINKHFDIEIEVKEIFLNPILSDFAKLIESKTAGEIDTRLSDDFNDDDFFGDMDSNLRA